MSAVANAVEITNAAIATRGLLSKPMGYQAVEYWLRLGREDEAWNVLESLVLSGHQWQKWYEYVEFHPSDDVSKVFLEYVEHTRQEEYFSTLATLAQGEA